MMLHKHIILLLSFLSPTLPGDDFIPSLLSLHLHHLLPLLPFNSLASYVTKNIAAVRKSSYALSPACPPTPRVCVRALNLLPAAWVSCPAPAGPSVGWDPSSSGPLADIAPAAVFSLLHLHVFLLD